MKLTMLIKIMVTLYLLYAGCIGFSDYGFYRTLKYTVLFYGIFSAIENIVAYRKYGKLFSCLNIAAVVLMGPWAHYNRNTWELLDVAYAVVIFTELATNIKNVKSYLDKLPLKRIALHIGLSCVILIASLFVVISVDNKIDSCNKLVHQYNSMYPIPQKEKTFVTSMSNFLNESEIYKDGFIYNKEIKINSIINVSLFNNGYIWLEYNKDDKDFRKADFVVPNSWNELVPENRERIAFVNPEKLYLVPIHLLKGDFYFLYGDGSIYRCTTEDKSKIIYIHTMKEDLKEIVNSLEWYMSQKSMIMTIALLIANVGLLLLYNKRNK